MLILKNYIVRRLLDRLSYWTTLLDTDIDKIAWYRILDWNLLLDNSLALGNDLDF